MYCIRYGAEDQRGRLLSSSHRLIVSSFHVSSAHRLIVSSSHFITAVTSSSSHCRHIVAFSHLHIISSPHTTNSVSQSHRLIVSSSHLLIVPSSSTINNSSSPHRPFVSSTHRHTVTSSQLRIISSPSHTIARPHRLVVWSSGRLVVSCVVCVCARRTRAYVCTRVQRPTQLAGSGGCAFAL